MSPAWIAPTLMAAGAACLAFAAFGLGPARAAEPERKSVPGWQLWECVPNDECRMRGRPLGRTACELDMWSLANVLPKGSRVACVRIEVKEQKR